MLFSATQTRKVEDLAKISLKKEPLYVGVDDNKETATVDGLEQVKHTLLKGVSPICERTPPYMFLSGLYKYCLRECLTSYWAKAISCVKGFIHSASCKFCVSSQCLQER